MLTSLLTKQSQISLSFQANIEGATAKSNLFVAFEQQALKGQQPEGTEADYMSRYATDANRPRRPVPVDAGPDIEPGSTSLVGPPKDWSSTHYPDSPTKEVGRGRLRVGHTATAEETLSRGAHQTGLNSRTRRRLRCGVRLKRIGGNDRQSVCEARTQQRSAILLYFNRQPCPSSRHVEQKVSHSYVRCHGHLPTLSGTVSTYV